jgi:succinate-semialdehyde dehydrogenase/glutarate-semialdehyde dehydrogenase
MKLSSKALLKDQCFLNGEWVGCPDITVSNPATGEMLARVPDFGAEEATQAVEAASAAFGSWSAKTAKERSGILRRWFELVRENREDLALIITSEQGKPLKEALSEIDASAASIEFYAEEAKRVYGDTIPSPFPESRIMVVKQPAGVVGAITPWNFPSSMITRKVAPALAVGCTVVLKPSEATPLSALALAVLAGQAGMPKGVLNIITGDAKSIGKVLTTHPDIRVVTFTGSTRVGRILMRQAADGIKKLGLELGGNAPFIVFDDADLDCAVEGAIASKFRNAGQTCVCANRFYVQDSIREQFVEKLIAATKKLKVGNGVDEGITQGPLISAEAVDKVQRHIKDAVDKGAELVLGGKPHALGRTFFEPTVLDKMSPDMLIAQEETFGPVAAVFGFTTEEDALKQANDTVHGLAAYFYARDVGRIFRVSEGLQYGMVGVNAGSVSTEVAPFGGIKQSGMGREGSHYGVDEFVNLKYVLVSGLQT